MTGFWGSVVGALLPDPERSAFVRRWGGDPGPASFVLGIAEFLAGVKWVYESAMGVLKPMADQIATAYLQQANQRTVGAEETLGFTWGGAMLWLIWLLHPMTWMLISIPLVGLLRVSAFLTTGASVAEPAVWALMRLSRLGRRRADAARERAEFGAATEPDEVEADGDGALSIYSPRRRPDWNELVTIEVAGRYYRMLGFEPVARAGRRRYRYRLAEAGEHDVIRRLVIYELPKTGVRWAAANADASRDAEPGGSSDAAS